VTIQRGAEWGTAIERPPELLVAGSDSELGRLVAGGRAAGAIGLSGGDLHRSLGSPPPSRQQMRRLPIDALLVELDGQPVLAVAHVIARRSWWFGPVLAVLNCDHVGAWNVAPRAHPNDGRFDTVEVDPAMSLRSRLQARRRLATGTHVPHPQISVGVAERRAWTFPRATPVTIDGVGCGRCTHLSVTISPDHFAICV
jgi:hypothetical protein